MSAFYSLISVKSKRVLDIESIGGICSAHAGSTFPVDHLIAFEDLSGRKFQAPAYRPDWQTRVSRYGERLDVPFTARILAWVAKYDDGQLFWLHSDCLTKDQIEVTTWGWQATYDQKARGDDRWLRNAGPPYPWLRIGDDPNMPGKDWTTDSLVPENLHSEGFDYE